MNKIKYDELVLLRIVVIVLLVLYHSFCIYIKAWERPLGFIDIKAYSIICFSCKILLLETFVFMSGFIFGHQLERGIITNLQQLVIGKLRRLWLPSVIFSVAYILLFSPPITFIKFVYRSIGATGHMWFLPMLFWCFIISYGISRIRINDKAILCILFLLTLMPYFQLPFQIGRTFQYIYYFYFGIVLVRYRTYLSQITVRPIYIFMLLLLVLIFLFVNSYKVCAVIAITLGVFLLYLLMLRISKTFKISYAMDRFSNMCFGIYLFQQFFLQLLYYHTSLPEMVGPYFLPWIGFIIAMSLSIICTYLLQNTKIGKSII